MSEFVTFLVIMVFFLLVIIPFIRRISLRRKIRRVIKKHPNTLRYLKSGTFKEHELLKSLKGKVYDELSNQKLHLDRIKLNKILDQEIAKVLKGWKRTVLVYFGVFTGIIVFCFAALLIIGFMASESNKPEKAVATSKQVEEKIIEQQSEADKATTAAEKHFNNGIAFMNNGQEQKAIKVLEKVKKSSNRYEEAQKNISTLKTNLFMKQAKNISYKELKKSPEKYKGEKLQLSGRIFNIQEINGKTILSLATAFSNGDYYGDDVFILFPTGTSLVEGDYIEIYGEMIGNYTKSQPYISEYLNNSQYTIYSDGETFIEQAPVIKTRIIIDSPEHRYGE